MVGFRRPAKKKIERDRRRGIMNRPVRAMVVGNPGMLAKIYVYQLFRGKGLCQEPEISQA